MVKKSFILIALLMATSIFYLKSCTSYKLDEATFYKDKHMELKIVRYQENIFLHYNGPVFRVACKSENTRSQSWHKVQETNWTQVYSPLELSNLGWDPSLDTLIKAARLGYQVDDVDTLIYRTSGASVTVSWDGCGTFKSWSPKKIPDELVNQEPYLRCLEESRAKEEIGALVKGWGESNCKSENFYSENLPTISDIEATRDGHASFIVTSKAFLLGKSYQITTSNYGTTWEVLSVLSD